MKKILKLFVILLAVIMVMPLTIVHANSSKTEKVLEKLNSSDFFKDINGTAKCEDDTIEIEYCITNSSINNLYFPYEDNVIEYDPGELTSYYDAEEASSHYMYAMDLITSALKLNGYTEEQIRAYMQSEDSNPTFEVNGFEFKVLGETQKFENDDDGCASSIEIAPMLIRIDVSKANLNSFDSDEAEKTNTTVEDVVNNLKSDTSFTEYKYEDEKIAYENEIEIEDYCITIEHTDYTYDYHNLYFDCVDDVLTFEAEEIESYEEANDVSEHEMWVMIFMQYALELNGYTDEEIRAFLNSEDSEPSFEKNGIEIKVLGESKEFTGDMGDTTTVTPISVKIDFAKANIDKEVKEYEVLDGENKTFDKAEGNKLKFEFSMDYDKFVEEGKVFIDNIEISRDNYTLSRGSTIVTFNDDFTETLAEGEHTIIAAIADGKAQASFTIAKTEEEIKDTTQTSTIEENKTNIAEEKETNTNTINNPKTGDNIVIWISLMILSIIGFAVTAKFINKNK